MAIYDFAQDEFIRKTKGFHLTEPEKIGKLHRLITEAKFLAGITHFNLKPSSIGDSYLYHWLFEIDKQHGKGFSKKFFETEILQHKRETFSKRLPINDISLAFEAINDLELFHEKYTLLLSSSEHLNETEHEELRKLIDRAARKKALLESAARGKAALDEAVRKRKALLESAARGKAALDEAVRKRKALLESAARGKAALKVEATRESCSGSC